MSFEDRVDAGERLAKALKNYQGIKNGLVIGLPRGGVIVAHEVAQALHLPLDVIITKKIGAPGNSELAIGAIDENGEGPLDKELIQTLGVTEAAIDILRKKTMQEVNRRLTDFRPGKSPLDLHQKTAILVDDGLATGNTMEAAIHSAKAKGAKAIIVAVPVTSRQAAQNLSPLCDQFIALEMPESFEAVGYFYNNFSQTTDEEVVNILKLY